MTAMSWMRKASGIVLIAMLAAILAACGGDDDGDTPDPTVTSAPVSAPTETSAPESGEVLVAASPTASPVASPAVVQPVASPVALSTSVMSREQYQQQILAAFPMEAPANQGGTIILGESGDISTVNPILAFDTTTFKIVGAMFETLLGASPIDGQPIPGLADSWEVSQDRLTYTFHLNQQATWHDGVDFSAEDVKFSFDAALDPNTGSSYTSQINDAIESYRVIDADTFEVVARDRFVSFLFNGPGSVYIMPKHIWESVDHSTWSFDGGSTGQNPERVVGTGPFKFGEWVQGERVTVVRNDDYYDIVPNIEAFTISVQPDAEASVFALQSGEIDMMEIIPAAQTQAVIDTEGLAVEIYDDYLLTLYQMNLDPERTELFTSKEVRQALFIALDRESITQNIFFGFGESAVGTQPKLSPAYAPDRMSPDYEFDPARAQELLAQAGWTDSNDNGTVDKDGEEFEFTMIYIGGDGTVEQIIAYMEEAWEEVGVEMNAESVGGTELLDRLRAHDFDMFLNGYDLSFDGDQGILFACDSYRSGFNFGRYCNSEWDALNELQKREFDPAQRTELLIQQSQIIWEEQPIGPIRFGVPRTGYSTKIHNFYPNGYGFLWSLPYVWVEE